MYIKVAIFYLGYFDMRVHPINNVFNIFNNTSSQCAESFDPREGV